jgi:hypothetical protein
MVLAPQYPSPSVRVPEQDNSGRAGIQCKCQFVWSYVRCFCGEKEATGSGLPLSTAVVDKRYAFPLKIFNHGAGRSLFQVNLAVSIVQEEIEAA